MQLNCKVMKQWQPPISTSTPLFQGYSPFVAKSLVPLLSDTTARRSAVDPEDLKPYRKSEKCHISVGNKQSYYPIFKKFEKEH